MHLLNFVDALFSTVVNRHEGGWEGMSSYRAGLTFLSAKVHMAFYTKTWRLVYWIKLIYRRLMYMNNVCFKGRLYYKS